METKVDYSHAFAPPHRITLSKPAGSMKTLVDLYPDLLKLSWSYYSLKDQPVNIWSPPSIDWGLTITLGVDGYSIPLTSWKRLSDRLPGFEAYAQADGYQCMIRGIATEHGDAIEMLWENQSTQELMTEVVIEHTTGGWVVSNPAWIDGENPNCLMAMQNEHPDRLLAICFGAQAYPIIMTEEAKREITVPMPDANNSIKGNPAKTIIMQNNIAPGKYKTQWLIRPYQHYEADITTLSEINWREAFDAASNEWHSLLDRAAEPLIPDDGVKNAFYACLADLFVMSEYDSAGNFVTSPGTQVYRSTNSGEGCFASTLLDQLGFSTEALLEQKVHIEAQGEDGNWCDPRGWAHHMWATSGFKARMVWEHYLLTRDKAYLSEMYPRLLAMTFWQESMRAGTRSNESGINYGLMPRGMGDCGLMNDTDYFGVFLPHNFYSVYADGVTLSAARALNRAKDIEKLESIYNTARDDLRSALFKGAIEEANGLKWIPGVAGKRCGSTWGALTAHYPNGILDASDPLLLGTFAHIESRVNSGGQPIGNGWMKDGCWVAISLDNLAMAHLARGDGDAASAYLYSAINHASFLTTWCEERGYEVASPVTSGDLQHLWTPLSVCSYIRNALVFEGRDGALWLASGTPREWLQDRKTLGCRGMRTYFGIVDYTIVRNDRNISIGFSASEISNDDTCRIHLRTPERLQVETLVKADCPVDIHGDVVVIKPRNGKANIRLLLAEDCCEE